MGIGSRPYPSPTNYLPDNPGVPPYEHFDDPQSIPIPSLTRAAHTPLFLTKYAQRQGLSSYCLVQYMLQLDTGISQIQPIFSHAVQQMNLCSHCQQGIRMVQCSCGRSRQSHPGAQLPPPVRLNAAKPSITGAVQPSPRQVSVNAIIMSAVPANCLQNNIRTLISGKLAFDIQ